MIREMCEMPAIYSNATQNTLGRLLKRRDWFELLTEVEIAVNNPIKTTFFWKLFTQLPDCVMVEWFL
jgi:hypothetical protein